MSGQGVGFGGKRVWRAAFSAAIGSICVVPQAEAAIYYWQNSYPGFAFPAPSARKAKAPHRSETKAVAAEKEAAKPQGPLIITISIAEQKLRLYDASGLYAVSPVSTGMPGHPTPMGVFNIIQKHKFHKSNIYSDAPMPFMQRITWSGVALHAGVVPGHPASHGCIRMPAAFATKMWGWTKLGARVVITPGAISPSDFSHPLLAAVKVAPQPAAMAEPKSDVAMAQESQTASRIEANAATPALESRVELRATIGHEDTAKPLAGELPAATAPPTKTADASDALPSSASLSDAPSVSAAKPASEPAQASDSEVRSVGAVSIQPSKDKPVTGDAAGPTGVKPQDTSAEMATSTPAVETPSPKTAGEAPAEKPVEAVPAAAGAPAATSNSPPAEIVPNPAPKPDLAYAINPKGQIAIFVSRKDSKLYVRQNFSPLFDRPVTIAADTRPLGTHVFTAHVDKSDANVLHWSVVSLPAPTRQADRRKEDQHVSRGRKTAPTAPVEARAQPLPDDPAEALDRLNLPADVMGKIFEAISTGGSIIVSDQGIAAGETGEGTDFIVSLR